MNNIEDVLKTELMKATPNVLDNILKKIDDIKDDITYEELMAFDSFDVMNKIQESNIIDMKKYIKGDRNDFGRNITNVTNIDSVNFVEALDNKKVTKTLQEKNISQKSNKKYIFDFKKYSQLAAIFIFVVVFSVSGFRYYNANFMLDSLVMLDVNPSIEVSTNKNDRVLDVKALNEDAIKILSNMNLKNTNLEVALNAIIGSMVKNGYLQDISKSILVSVENKNDNRAKEVRENIVNDLNYILKEKDLDVDILSQNVKNNKEIETISSNYNISKGKANLIYKILEDNKIEKKDDLIADLSNSTIDDVNNIIKEKNVKLNDVNIKNSLFDNKKVNENMFSDINMSTDLNIYNDEESENIQNTPSQGNQLSNEFISSDKALDIALNKAGVSRSNAYIEKNKFDKYKYEIKFRTNDSKYEIEVDARNGNILEFEKDVKIPVTPSQGNQLSNEFISSDKALDIALNKAGVSRSNAYVEKNKFDKYKYEIKFRTNDSKYEIEVDARNGNILEFEKDVKIPVTPSQGNQLSNEFISSDKALDIALNKAGVSRSNAYIEKNKFDKYKYEIKFRTNDSKYEIEVDARNGNILEFEKEYKD